MIISIASGKGGTGKTTISTNLATSLDFPVQLLDCDVEEPNAHLFIKPTITNERESTVFVPKIDDEKCTACKKCAEICRFNALTVIGDKVLCFPELCHSCKGCMLVCPEHAISADSRVLGVVEDGEKGHISFHQGRMRIGEAMSPPLIKEVRAAITPETPVIIDAPPGTSCPVITAMKDTDFVLLVTEPTPFGLHDLTLAVEAVKVLGIPCGLVINRSDLGYDKVREYITGENIPILMEIPFDRKIAEAYSRGEMLVESSPEWKTKFQELYRKIEQIVQQQVKK